MPVPVMRVENLSELVRQAVFLQRNARCDLKYKTDLPQEPLFFKCDGRQISQAITNLLKNAAEAIDGSYGLNSDQGEICLRLNHSDNVVKIEIEDNGKGLPEHQRDRLTEPYFTTRSKGTGLGLAIVRKIMEDHKGSLQLRDGKSVGAIVTLCMNGPRIIKSENDCTKNISDKGPRASVDIID